MGQMYAAEIAGLMESMHNYYATQEPKDNLKTPDILYNYLDKKHKTYPSTKETVNMNVHGLRKNVNQSYEGDDIVTYQTGNTADKVAYKPWRVHSGNVWTEEFLQNLGVEIIETPSHKKKKSSISTKSDRHIIFNQMKLEEVNNEKNRSFSHNQDLWSDNLADPKKGPGLLGFILDNPAAPGTTGGLDRTLKPWWRNHAMIGIPEVDLTGGYDPREGKLIKAVRRMVYLCGKNGGAADLFLCGRVFYEALESEVLARQQISITGISGKTELGAGEFVLDNHIIRSDPYMDVMAGMPGYPDMSRRCYMVDTDSISLFYQKNERKKRRYPERPHNQYLFFTGVTDVMCLAADRLNSSGVIEIAV